MDNKKLLEEAFLRASEDYLNYGACSQCVVKAVSEVLNLDNEQLIKSSHFMAGGGCLTGDGTCGALAGGLLVLGSYAGRTKNEMASGKYKERLKIGKELIDRFKLKFGGISCNDFKRLFTGQEFDMWGSEDILELKKQMKGKCSQITGQVAAWVVEIILNEMDKEQKS